MSTLREQYGFPPPEPGERPIQYGLRAGIFNKEMMPQIVEGLNRGMSEEELLRLGIKAHVQTVEGVKALRHRAIRDSTKL